MRPIDRDRFEALYRTHYGAVLAYARRRTSPADAEEIAAEVFTVALRRRAELTEPVLPWLLVVARHALANRARADVRARDKAEQAAYLNPHATRDHADVLVERDVLLRAFAALPEQDREALSLVAWEGLPTGQAAKVAGITHAAFRMRLSRARRRLAQALDEDRPSVHARPVETT